MAIKRCFLFSIKERESVRKIVPPRHRHGGSTQKILFFQRKTGTNVIKSQFGQRFFTSPSSNIWHFFLVGTTTNTKKDFNFSKFCCCCYKKCREAQIKHLSCCRRSFTEGKWFFLLCHKKRRTEVWWWKSLFKFMSPRAGESSEPYHQAVISF